MADKKKRKRTKEDKDEDLPFKSILESDEAILKLLKSYISSSLTAAAAGSSGASSSSSSKPLTLADLSLSSSCREVADLSLSSVQTEIETVIVQIARSILAGDGFSFSVPSRAASNQLYVPELDRIVLKDKSTLRPFASVSSVRKTTITTRILALIHQLCLRNIHVTKRDLFYTDVKLFQVKFLPFSFTHSKLSDLMIKIVTFRFKIISLAFSGIDYI